MNGSSSLVRIWNNASQCVINAISSVLITSTVQRQTVIDNEVWVGDCCRQVSLQWSNHTQRYKKSELMLTRCARAHGSSCSQVILVCLHPFRRNSLFCSHKLPKCAYLQPFSRQTRQQRINKHFLEKVPHFDTRVRSLFESRGSEHEMLKYTSVSYTHLTLPTKRIV